MAPPLPHPAMPTPKTSRFRARTILCAFDASGVSDGALVLAAYLAERSRAALHLVHVTPLFRARLAHAGGGPDTAVHDRTRAAVDGVLGDGAFDVVGPVLHESHGESPADGILRYAADVGADLVVVGTHGRQGIERLLAGSVAAEVLGRSSVPVLVVPARAGRTVPGPEAPVVVGVDLGDPPEPAARLGRDLAEDYGAGLVLATVRTAPPDTLVPTGPHHGLAPAPPRLTWDVAHRALHAIAVDLGDDQAEEHVMRGHPATELVSLARRARAGLVVVGTHGRHGWDRLRLGSVAEGVVREAPCPVLVVPTRAVARPASAHAIQS